MTPEEHASIVEAVTEKLNKTLTDSLEFEKERAAKRDEENDGHVWVAIYCSHIKSQTQPQYPAELADRGLYEYKKRFNPEQK